MWAAAVLIIDPEADKQEHKVGGNDVVADENWCGCGVITNILFVRIEMANCLLVIDCIWDVDYCGG